MTNQQHPITPPPALQQHWLTAAGVGRLTPQLAQALRWAAEWGSGVRQQ